MKEHYVSYSQAQSLKLLGFDWEVRGYYTRDDNFRKVREVTALNHNDSKKFKNILSAPRLDQAQAWLRDCKGIGVEPFASIPDKMWAYRLYHTKGEKFGMTLVISNKSVVVYEFDTYELALSAGISKALELLGKEEKE